MSDEDTDRVRCPDCKSTFESERGMENHRTKIHDVPDEPYLQRYKRIREEIPERYRDAYDDITGGGKSPSAVQAAVAYIESDATQDEMAAAFGVTPVSIRSHVRSLIDRGVVTLAEVRENNPDNGLQNFGEQRHDGQQSINL